MRETADESVTVACPLSLASPHQCSLEPNTGEFFCDKHGSFCTSMVPGMAREVASELAVAFRPFIPLPPLRPAAPEPARLGDYLPNCLAGWIEDSAERLNVPPSMIAGPLLVALAGVVGRSHRIRPKALDDWSVYPILWGAVVAPSGAGKSPALDVALDGIARLESSYREAWAADRPQVEAHLERLRAQVAALKERLRQSHGGNRSKNKGEAESADDLERELAATLSELEVEERTSKPRRLRTSDATIEKLGELMIENPRGLLLFRDELAGWIAALDRADRPADRAFFLEAWQGSGSHYVDRIGRGSQFVPALAASVLGGIQPCKLEPLVSGSAGDGFLPRFQILVWPEERSARPYLDRRPLAAEADRARCAVRLLDEAAASALQTEGRTLSFDPIAQELFIATSEDLDREVRATEAPALREHLAKYQRLLPAIALLLQLVDDPCSNAVGIAAAKRALHWLTLLREHAGKVYAHVARPDLAAAHALAAKIKAGAVENGAPVRSIYRAGWSGLADSGTVAAGFELLEHHGYVSRRVEYPETGGRPSARIWVNPRGW